MGKYILFCEDDEGILDVGRVVLEDKGYKVVLCSNGHDVIKQIDKEKPAVILLDLWIPGINGDEITRELKSRTDTKHIPVIIISANKDTAQIAKQTGADDFLAKPFDIEDLEQIVAKYVKSRNL